MVTEFYEGTKALNVNEISEPIESSYGYHIIKRIALPAMTATAGPYVFAAIAEELGGGLDDYQAALDFYAEKKDNIKLNDIMLMTIDKNGNKNIIKKENK